jgi:hypothetical protein
MEMQTVAKRYLVLDDGSGDDGSSVVQEVGTKGFRTLPTAEVLKCSHCGAEREPVPEAVGRTRRSSATVAAEAQEASGGNGATVHTLSPRKRALGPSAVAPASAE